MAKYPVIGRLRHKGQAYAPGDKIDLSSEEAKALKDAPQPTIGEKEDTEEEGAEEEGTEEEDTEEEGAEFANLPPPGEPEILPPPEPEEGKPDINSASLEVLVQAFKGVNGIGKGSAQAIIENRPYESLEEVPDKADLIGIARASWPDAMKLLSLDELE